MDKNKISIPQSIHSPSGKARLGIKICGMKHQDNMQEVAALQPDYLGFIFYEKSTRNFDADNIPELSNSIKKTGVFVDADLDFVLEKINKHNLQAVQLHGKESPEYCVNLREQYEAGNIKITASTEVNNQNKKKTNNSKKIEIFKVFSIKDTFDFSVLEPYENVCDYFLFDTKGKLHGGNGYTFNWNVLNDYPSKKPFFLSGGIGLEEAEAITAFANSKASKYCYALDVNSKFEIEPGLKDVSLLKAFKQSAFAKEENNKFIE